jgi:hypothetical protein
VYESFGDNALAGVDVVLADGRALPCRAGSSRCSSILKRPSTTTLIVRFGGWPDGFDGREDTVRVDRERLVEAAEDLAADAERGGRCAAISMQASQDRTAYDYFANRVFVCFGPNVMSCRWVLSRRPTFAEAAWPCPLDACLAQARRPARLLYCRLRSSAADIREAEREARAQ